MKDEKEKGVQQRIRIYSIDVWEKIKLLDDTNKFKGFNDVINQALEIGAPLLYDKVFNFEEFYNKTKKIKTDLLEKNVAELAVTSDQIYVCCQILKHLMASVYNIELAKISNEELSAEMIESGLFSNLPDNLQEIEDSFNKKIKRGK